MMEGFRVLWMMMNDGNEFSTRNQSRKSDIFKVPFFSMTLGPDFFRRQKTIFCNNFVIFSFLSIQT